MPDLDAVPGDKCGLLEERLIRSYGGSQRGIRNEIDRPTNVNDGMRLPEERSPPTEPRAATCIRT